LNLLYLTPQLPFPANSGGKIKSFKMIQYLSEHYDLSLGCLIKEDQSLHITKFLNEVNVKKIYSEIVDKPRSLKNYLLSYFSQKPLSVYRNFSASFEQEISKIIYDYDVVFVDHFLMFQYIPEDYKGRVLLHQHNAEYVMWSRYAELQQNIFLKVALKLESSRIRKYEKLICDEATMVLASPNDIVELEKLSPEAKFHETFHLGDDKLLQFYHPGFELENANLTYIGSLDWKANEDGLRWFIENVWEGVLFQNPSAKLNIIGKGASSDFNEFCNRFNNIEILGYVESLEEALMNSKVLIAPLRFGSGMKVKTINSLYTGIPLVTTSVGAEGIDIENGVHACIEDSVKGQIDSINKLIAERNSWELIGGEARELAKIKYTWKKNLNNLKEVIDGGSQICEHQIQGVREKYAA